MNWRKHFVEAATLIVAAVVCAMVANAFASRERKLVVVPQSAPLRQHTTPDVPVPATETRQPANDKKPTPTKQPTTENREPRTDNKQPPIENRQPPTENRQFTPHPDKAYLEIHGDDVEALHKKGVLFLDARRTSVYEQGHIPGARPFSVWESDVDEKVNKLFAERSDPRDQNLPIVIYCSGGDCEDSHMLAQKLWGIQFNNVYVYKDGFPDWQKRGLPIHTGSAP
jgi:rhodanese-related sulfurtransferase